MNLNSRYTRQITLNDIGSEGQAKIQSGKVLVIGAGGLSCPALQYLVAAGVGHITIIDPDVVDLSNLHRQVLFAPEDIGEFKAETAAHKLTILNPDVQITPIVDFFKKENAVHLARMHDIVLDGSDNFSTRYLVNDACILSKKPFIFCALRKFDIQTSVFNWQDGPSYRCLFPSPPENVPNCSEEGIIGSVAGIAGSIQATEVIKILAGMHTELCGSLFCLNVQTYQTYKLKIESDSCNFDIRELADDYSFDCFIDHHILSYSEALKKTLLWVFVGESAIHHQIPFTAATRDVDSIISLCTKGDVILVCETGKSSEVLASQISQRSGHHIFSLKNGMVGINPSQMITL